jgi:peptidoglycan/xylan/chitin deacetylase (PgdA/CDA1 family)
MSIYPRLERSPRPQRRRRPHYLLPVIAAAALILLLVGGGAYLLVARSPHAQGSTAQASPSASPTASASPSPHLHHIAVPILMYHHIAPVREGSSLLYASPRELEAQLAYLQAHGYHVVTLQQLYDAWTKGARLPAKPVVLSFDDGYLDQYRYAAPLLNRYHDPAVLNLIVDNLGRVLTSGMVKQMIASGWEVDSHTITHRDLTKLPAATVRRELRGSRDLLRRTFGVSVNFFCYPGGIHDAAVVAAVRQAGYLAATSIQYGLADISQRFALPRIVVYWGESLGRFAARLHAERWAEMVPASAGP